MVSKQPFALWGGKLSTVFKQERSLLPLSSYRKWSSACHRLPCDFSAAFMVGWGRLETTAFHRGNFLICREETTPPIKQFNMSVWQGSKPCKKATSICIQNFVGASLSQYVTFEERNNTQNPYGNWQFLLHCPLSFGAASHWSALLCPDLAKVRWGQSGAIFFHTENLDIQSHNFC